MYSVWINEGLTAHRPLSWSKRQLKDSQNNRESRGSGFSWVLKKVEDLNPNPGFIISWSQDLLACRIQISWNFFYLLTSCSASPMKSTFRIHNLLAT